MTQTEEKEQTREEWLNSLNVGDKVCYNQLIYGKSYIISTIKRITPTRRFILNNDSKFNNYGFSRAEGWHSTQINPLTEEIKQFILKQLYLKKIEDIHLSELNVEQLHKILKIITNNKIKK